MGLTTLTSLKITGNKIGVTGMLLLKATPTFGFRCQRKRGLNKSGEKGEKKMGSEPRVVINTMHVHTHTHARTPLSVQLAATEHKSHH